MALFNFFKNKSSLPAEEQNEKLPEIPEHIFIENSNAEHPQLNNQIAEGIYSIYNYLMSDFESKGFSDALVNPDESYKNDNLRLIRYELEIVIHKVNTYHESLMKDIDFHISSRTRAGLIDIVEELKTKKEDLISHQTKVREIQESLSRETGLYERALLSYNRGFAKGLTSITQSSLLSKKF